LCNYNGDGDCGDEYNDVDDDVSDGEDYDNGVMMMMMLR
jgi:hypothetical protein